MRDLHFSPFDVVLVLHEVCLVHYRLCDGRMDGWMVIIGHWSSKRTFSAIMDVLCPLSFIFSF